MTLSLQEELLLRAVTEQLGQPVQTLTPLGGGCINRAYRAEFKTGPALFIKTHDQPPVDFFPLEASGLAWLAEPAVGPHIPTVVAASNGSGRLPALLILEYIAVGPQPAPRNQALLGRRLAELHRSGAPVFGLAHDNYLATLSQDNRPLPTWAEFYGERRLQPLLRQAYDRQLLPSAAQRACEAVLQRLPEVVGPQEPPARLHGDLWGGNVLWNGQGQPVLIDPAVYGGHREVDLAMMRLFGGFEAECFAAYNEVFPLGPGHEARVALYQLYPLLVHLLLFGRSYLPQLIATVAEVP